MTREEAKEVFLNRGFIDGIYNGNKWREACVVISKWLEQEPRCKDCKWWKDSDGKFRRGCGAESPCPINTHVVYCGEGYCYMFQTKADMEGNEV